nr:hypothetical protein [Tanacetum cinerariifolium]
MSRDVITVGSTMRIPLLYRGEYSQWRERFVNYLEEQTDGEAMINSIQNEWKQYGTLMRQTKNLMDINIDALYNILKQNQGDVNDALGYKKKAVVVTSDPLALVAEKTKQNQGDVNDALGYKKKAVVVTSDPLAMVTEKTKVSKRKEKVEVQIESEGSDDEDITDLKKITALLAKAFNRKKYYGKPTNNNLRTSSASSLTNKKPEYEGNFAKDCKKAKDSDQEINANLVFMAQIEKVLSDSDESSSSAEETIAEVAYYTSESESESEYETLEYYDNSTNYGLFVNDNDDQEIFHDAIEYASENFIENHIDSQKHYNKSEVDHNDSEEKEHLIDKLIQKFNHKIAKCRKRIEKANQQSKDLENQNKDLQEKYDVLINRVNTFEEQNNEFNEQMKVLNEKNANLLAQMKVLQDQLKVKHVVIDTHTECQAQYAKLKEERYKYMIRYFALCDNDKQHRKKIEEQEILFDKMSRQLVEMNNNVLRLQEKILEKETKILELEGCVSNKDVEIEKCLERLNECENKLHKIGQTNQTIHMIMPSKDTLYNGRKGIGFENPSYFEKARDLRPILYDEKINFLNDYFEEIINPDFEKIDSSFQQTSSLKPYVPTVILEKIIIDLEDEVVSLLEKEKANLKTIESLKSKDLDTFSSVRRPKQTSVIWKKKRLSNTSNVDLSSVSHSKLNKDVKRYSRKDLLSCNNSHLGETSCAYVCNDAMNVSCNFRLCDSFNENNLFILDDESVRISLFSMMPFRKKPRDSLNVLFKRNSNQSLPRTVHRWLPKMQPLAEPVAKWIPRVELIAGYRDVVIGSMTIKKVYYVEG